MTAWVKQILQLLVPIVALSLLVTTFARLFVMFTDVRKGQRTTFYIFFKTFLFCFHVFPDEFMSLLLLVSWKDSQTLLRGSWSASFVATCDGSFDFFVFAPGGSFEGNIYMLTFCNQPHKFTKASSGRCRCASLCHFDFTKDWLGATTIYLIDAKHEFLAVHANCLNFHSPGGEGPSPDRRSLESQAEGIGRATVRLIALI